MKSPFHGKLGLPIVNSKLWLLLEMGLQMLRIVRPTAYLYSDACFAKDVSTATTTAVTPAQVQCQPRWKICLQGLGIE